MFSRKKDKARKEKQQSFKSGLMGKYSSSKIYNECHSLCIISKRFKKLKEKENE